MDQENVLEIYNKLLAVKVEPKVILPSPAQVFKTGATEVLTTKGGSGLWRSQIAGGATEKKQASVAIFVDYDVPL